METRADAAAVGKPQAVRRRKRTKPRRRFAHLEGPHVRPHPPKASLDLIGNGDSAILAHEAMHLLQVTVGRHNLSAAADERLDDKRGWGHRAFLEQPFELTRGQGGRLRA